MRTNFTSKVQYTYFFDIICAFLYMPAPSFLFLLFVNSSLPSSTWYFFLSTVPFPFQFCPNISSSFHYNLPFSPAALGCEEKGTTASRVLPVSIFSCPLGHNVRHPVFKITPAPICLIIHFYSALVQDHCLLTMNVR